MGSRWIGVTAVVVIALVGGLWLMQRGDKGEQKVAPLPEQTKLQQEESHIRVEVVGRDLEVKSLQHTPDGWALFVSGNGDGTDLDELLKQSAQLFQSLSRLDADFSDIGLLLRTDDLKDVYGNTLKELPIVEIGLSRQTFEKIDWNGFEPADFERVADRYWVHDEIKRLTAEKKAQEKSGGAGSSSGGSSESSSG